MDFIQEYLKLRERSPRAGCIQLQSINSEYTFNVDQCRNCYLVANAVKNEDCMYGRDFYDNHDCIDCDHVMGCTLCYECINCKNCYDSSYLQDCESSQNCDYGYDLKGCSDCIGCAGLRRKKFHIFNAPYSPEAFSEKKKSLTKDEIYQNFEALKLKTPRIFARLIDAEECSGDYIHNSQRAHSSFDAVGCQDVGYVEEVKNLRDSYDITILEESSLCYECSSSHILYNCNFCFMCLNSSNLEYCELVMNSENCFGCVSLNHKKFHILNQPYSTEQYAKKVAEIKDQMRKEGSYGRWYLPPCHPYQDTVAVWGRM